MWIIVPQTRSTIVQLINHKKTIISIGYFDNYFTYTCMDNVIPAQIAYAISYVKFSIYIHTYIVISQLPISTII